MVKRLIAYMSGGLGNRLKPLASCMWYARQTNRELVICWPTFLRCLASYSDLYQTPIQQITLLELEKLQDVKMYIPQDAADYEFNLNGTNSLRKLYYTYGGTELTQIRNMRHQNQENIVVFANGFLPGVSYEDNKECLQSLEPIDTIRHMYHKFQCEFPIDKSFIGVHARGTDFEDGGATVHRYIDQMLALGEDKKFFVCSDSPEYEHVIQENVKNVLFRKKNNNVYKQNPSQIWSNNVLTSPESVQEALVDLMLLADTDLQVYHPNSSFADLAKLMSRN